MLYPRVTAKFSSSPLGWNSFWISLTIHLNVSSSALAGLPLLKYEEQNDSKAFVAAS
jgi:hypothetical protein